jgi:hypothetical protein
MLVNIVSGLMSETKREFLSNFEFMALDKLKRAGVTAVGLKGIEKHGLRCLRFLERPFNFWNLKDSQDYRPFLILKHQFNSHRSNEPK